ncbi:MAG: hypothetical protein CUN56_02825 [Phototrophicales bacterium]|nr:MAG: hypothetical protein CUN56_02825 [Phototrophicales bacterium]
MTMKIKFVTDSVADIPPHLVEKWDITVIPCFVNYGGNSYADDGVELIREEYYQILGTLEDVPTTSAMSPDFAREFIDRAYQDADHLVMITTPAHLSGIHNAFRLGSAHLPQDHVTLIDSGQLSIGIGWQVLAGAEVAAETGDLQKTLAAIEYIQRTQQVYAGINDLAYLRRSGRVGWAAASIGTLLNIKPVVHVERGNVESIARVRSFKRALDKLAELAQENAPYDKMAILHINNEDGLAALKERLADILPDETIVGLIGPALGTHIGPGSVGFAGITKGWKDAIST